MAKAPQTQGTTVGGFHISFGEAPPEVVRRVGAATSPVAEAMKAMPAPQNGKIAQFFVPVSVPDTITDPTEREKALKEEARKTSNRLSGIARRIAKGDDSVNFALRTKKEGDEIGIRVYRIAPVAATA